MEVGILTMHRVVNYGSFMQAYSLKRVVESFGHSASFRDFRPGEAKHKGAKVVKPGLLDKIGKVPGALADLGGTFRKRTFRKRLHDCFHDVCWPLLGIPSDANHDLSCDLMIIGSDEVFNYTQNHGIGYVPSLFGHQVDAPSIVSYAASAGYANWADVMNDGMREELAAGFRKMWRISVRDENTREIVVKCAGIEPTMVIDPTLIHDFSDQVPAERLVQGEYLLVYAYEGRMESDEEIRAVRKFAAERGLKVVSAGFYHRWCDMNIVVTPFELMSVFRDAAYVVTDTFHGSIFAMKFKRQFATFLRQSSVWGSNSNKVAFLLQQFGMESRIVSDLDQLGKVLASDSPYEEFERRHRSLRTASLEFLASVLS